MCPIVKPSQSPCHVMHFAGRGIDVEAGGNLLCLIHVLFPESPGVSERMTDQEGKRQRRLECSLTSRRTTTMNNKSILFFLQQSTMHVMEQIETQSFRFGLNTYSTQLYSRIMDNQFTAKMTEHVKSQHLTSTIESKQRQFCLL